MAAAGACNVLAGSIGWKIYNWIHFLYIEGLVGIKTISISSGVESIG